jgi:hypothetical protein
MAGLARICKAYGRMRIQGVMWVWDYANDCAVKEDDMPDGSDRWKESERAKWAGRKPQPLTNPPK